MKIVGLMPVRNEAWVLGLSARVALRWCDELVILLHDCTDATEDIVREISKEHGGLVTLSETGEWAEMQHRQRLLETARHLKATHIAMVDADEVLTGDLLAGPQGSMVIRTMIENAPRDTIMRLPGYNLRGQIATFHSNGLWGNRWFSVAFRDHPDLHWGGDLFHHREPMGRQLGTFNPVKQGHGGVMHLWGLNERRLKAKHALYKITERIRWPNKPMKEIEEQYSWAIHGGRPYESSSTWKFATLPASYWAPHRDLLKYLHVDEHPWQEDECKRLMRERGAERFAGLDLFGVV